ncbi:MAG: hypothetical protein HYS21_13070 [Deltaproteobacteria bacterium]|nr:hypothetical protein [Deltaproteobacteria bacterium]
MVRRKIFLFISFFLLMAATASSAYWNKRFVTLKDQLNQGSSGEVSIERMGRIPGQRVLGITVYKLKPNSTYSVWFVNKGETTEMKPAGIDTNHFKTDGAGNGRYVTTTYEDVLDDWRYIEINLHPDNNPANTKDMILTLKGDMIYGFHS